MTTLTEFKETPKNLSKNIFRIQFKKWHKLPIPKLYHPEKTHELFLSVIGEKAVGEKLWRFSAKDTLPTKITYLEKEISISEKQIFRQFNFNIFSNLYRKISNVKTQFRVIFFYNLKTKKFEPVELKNNEDISGYTLYTATHATVYRRALGDLIQNVLGDKGKYIIYAIIIIIVVVGIAIGYPYLTSHVVTPITNSTSTIIPSPTPLRVR